MKIYFIIIFLFSAALMIFSMEIIKFEDAEKIMESVSGKDIKLSFEKIKNKVLEKETGWVYSIITHNDTSDIIYVEMDKPDKDFSKNKPDLFFYIDKNISKRLLPYQLIYFDGTICNFENGLIEIKDVFLSGIMRKKN